MKKYFCCLCLFVLSTLLATRASAQLTKEEVQTYLEKEALEKIYELRIIKLMEHRPSGELRIDYSENSMVIHYGDNNSLLIPYQRIKYIDYDFEIYSAGLVLIISLGD
ncbi:MAG: hypothetical protein ACFB0B_05520 [Thermonemataceae bacterium]